MQVNQNVEVRLEPLPSVVWGQVLSLLETRLSVPKFQAFIRPTQLLELNSTEAIIGVNNDFNKDNLSRDLLPQIADAFESVLNRKVDVRVLVSPDLNKRTYVPSIASITVLADNTSSNTMTQSLPSAGTPVFVPAAKGAGQTSTGLNPKYTFTSFVVGAHNRFCHAAAMAIASNPGQAYNPLFIYGGVGLGKTHIMQAIGHEIIEHFPGLSVKYVTCERFTNELINFIVSGRMMNDFRKRYREVDVLLVDDVQFIEGKAGTQEEFFHTFNALKESGKQIVISSDRPPQALSKLEERLRSRFEWGLVADIQAPDLETRAAILRRKSQTERMPVSDEVINYIASNFSTNIRELEGALLKAHAYSSMTGSNLTAGTIESVLFPAGRQQTEARISIERIVETVGRQYSVDIKKLKSSDRSAELALPRHIAMFLCHEILGASFPRIGQFFGNRRHTSAIHAHKRIRSLIETEPKVSASVQNIRLILSK